MYLYNTSQLQTAVQTFKIWFKQMWFKQMWHVNSFGDKNEAINTETKKAIETLEECRKREILCDLFDKFIK